jgi:hypothetical protein
MNNLFVQFMKNIFRLPKDTERIIFEFIDQTSLSYIFYVVRKFMFYRHTSYYIDEVTLFKHFLKTDLVAEYVANNFSGKKISSRKTLISGSSITREKHSNENLKKYVHDDENTFNIQSRRKSNNKKKKLQDSTFLSSIRREKKTLFKQRQKSRDWKQKQYCTHINDMSAIVDWHSKYLLREKEIESYRKSKEQSFEYDDWWLTPEFDENEHNEWSHIFDCGYDEVLCK